MFNRYKILFNNLSLKKEGCFVPFVVLGDPCIKISLKIIELIIHSGADAIEVGIPFSDPMADGPIIQNANLRAFKSGITVAKCFKLISIIRNKYQKIPIGLLTYSNIIYNYGIKQFYSMCSDVQLDSVLVADLPIEESKNFVKLAKEKNISPIFICPPNANTNLVKEISANSDSYIYLLSRSGVTGHKNKKYKPLGHLIKEFNDLKSVPLLQGFGISESSEIQKIIRSGIAGVICGSVIIQKIEKYYNDNYLMMNKIKKIVSSLKKSTLKLP